MMQAFEHVEPNEVTRITVRIKDTSVLVGPLTTDARGVLIVGDFKLKTNLMPDYPKTSIRASLSDAFVLVAEKMQDLPADKRQRARSTLEHWGVSWTGFNARISKLSHLRRNVDWYPWWR